MDAVKKGLHQHVFQDQRKARRSSTTARSSSGHLLVATNRTRGSLQAHPSSTGSETDEHVPNSEDPCTSVHLRPPAAASGDMSVALANSQPADADLILREHRRPIALTSTTIGSATSSGAVQAPVVPQPRSPGSRTPVAHGREGGEPRLSSDAPPPFPRLQVVNAPPVHSDGTATLITSSCSPLFFV